MSLEIDLKSQKGAVKISVDLDREVKNALIIYALIKHREEKGSSPTLSQLTKYCNELYKWNGVSINFTEDDVYLALHYNTHLAVMEDERRYKFNTFHLTENLGW